MPRWLRLKFPDPIVAIAGCLGGVVSDDVVDPAGPGSTELPSGALDPDFSSDAVPLLLLVPSDLSIELLSWLTAFCVAENTDEKKLDACGCVNDPPGVLASSMAGVSGLTIPLDAIKADLRRRTAAADDWPEGIEPRANLELPTGRRVPNSAGLGCVGLGIMGVGGVMKVVGVPTAGGVTRGCVCMRGDVGLVMAWDEGSVSEREAFETAVGEIDASVLSGKGCNGLVFEVDWSVAGGVISWVLSIVSAAINGEDNVRYPAWDGLVSRFGRAALKWVLVVASKGKPSRQRCQDATAIGCTTRRKNTKDAVGST
jgi:hypothetical protein